MVRCRGVGLIRVVVLCRRIHHRHGRGDQLPCRGGIGLAAGRGEQPRVTDAMEPLRQNVNRKRLMNPSGLSVIVRYRACPLRR
jgi:hypothetical protein